MNTDIRPITIKFIPNLFLAISISLANISLSFAVTPAPVIWAEDLVQHITPELNNYANNPSYIYWAGVNGASAYENRSQCSTFLTNLLKQSFGWNNAKFKTWFGSTSPTTAMYHNAIQAGNGFLPKTHANDIAVGDIIAIKYPDGRPTSGHTMLVRTAPQAMAAKAPLIAGTRQYAIEVFDSSQSGHGASDTRKMPDGSWDSGVGFGFFRIYANSITNEIVGHTWSTYANSVYYSQSDQHLAVGSLLE